LLSIGEVPRTSKCDAGCALVQTGGSSGIVEEGGDDLLAPDADQGGEEGDEVQGNGSGGEDDADAAAADGSLSDGDEDVQGEGRSSRRGRRHAAAPPPPPPVTTTFPVASAVPPRLFVVYPSGRGYEVVPASVVSELASDVARWPGSVVDMQPLTGGLEPGAAVQSFLRQVPTVDRSVAPLPVGPVTLAQRHNPHAAELLPSFRRLSVLASALPGGGVGGLVPNPTNPPSPRAPSFAQSAAANAASASGTASLPPSLQPLAAQQPQATTNAPPTMAAAATPAGPALPIEPLSKSKYLPRVVAQHQPAPPPPPPLPVLLYNEVLHLPRIEPHTGAAIEAALAAAQQEEAAIEEGHTRTVPFADTRPEEARAADAEVLQQVRELNIGGARIIHALGLLMHILVLQLSCSCEGAAPSDCDWYALLDTIIHSLITCLPG
jgi:hypothetical protein